MEKEDVQGARFAAAYIRVSTDDQVELSPDSQLEKIKEYAQKEGIVLLQDQIYIDPGISGKKAEKRPAFMKMIATAKSEDCPFSVILLWKYSRFARNQEESIFYKSILRSKCGVEVVSVSEPLIAGPFGSLIERIIEWMDEFYSIRLSQEVKRSMKTNAERGKLQCVASFGYRIEDGKLVPVPEEAKIVRHIFDSFLDGNGLYHIARELNALNVRTHRGNRFENRTVEYIVRNPVYIGKLRWNPEGKTRRDFFNENLIITDGGHEPIVSTDIWNAAQRKLDEVKNQWGYKARPTYELKGWTSGIVRCASCGATLVFAKPHYYKCNNYARGRCTHSQHIRKDLLEEAIISKMQQDAEGTSASLAYTIAVSNSSGGRQISTYRTMLRQLEQKKTRLRDAYLAGVIELEDFSRAQEELSNSVAETQQKLEEALAKNEEGVVISSIKSSIKTALETIQSPAASLEDKNRAARSVIERCTYDREKSLIEITYRIMT